MKITDNELLFAARSCTIFIEPHFTTKKDGFLRANNLSI